MWIRRRGGPSPPLRFPARGPTGEGSGERSGRGRGGVPLGESWGRSAAAAAAALEEAKEAAELLTSSQTPERPGHGARNWGGHGDCGDPASVRLSVLGAEGGLVRDEGSAEELRAA